MSIIGDMWALLTETPDQRRIRYAAEARRNKPKPKPGKLPAHPNSPYARFPPTSHPDDYGDGTDGLDRYMAGKKKR